jgi:hypothetical protein
MAFRMAFVSTALPVGDKCRPAHPSCRRWTARMSGRYKSLVGLRKDNGRQVVGRVRCGHCMIDWMVGWRSAGIEIGM